MEGLTDQQLREELRRFGFSSPPVTASTRSVLQKKLVAFQTGSIIGCKSPPGRASSPQGVRAAAGVSGGNQHRYSTPNVPLPARPRYLNPPARRYENRSSLDDYSPGAYSGSRTSSFDTSSSPLTRRPIRTTPSPGRPSYIRRETVGRHLSLLTTIAVVLISAAVTYLFWTYLEPIKAFVPQVLEPVQAAVASTAAVVGHALVAALLLLFITVTVYGSLSLRRMWKQQREKHDNAVAQLVDEVISLMRRHHAACQSSGINSALAVEHVRDMVLEGDAQGRKLWQEVLHHVASNESRLRIESQLIDGTDHLVFVWLPHPSSPATDRYYRS